MPFVRERDRFRVLPGVFTEGAVNVNRSGRLADVVGRSIALLFRGFLRVDPNRNEYSDHQERNLHPHGLLTIHRKDGWCDVRYLSACQRNERSSRPERSGKRNTATAARCLLAIEFSWPARRRSMRAAR